MRSDVFASLFPGTLKEAEAAQPAPALGGVPWHYVVADAKFTTLHLLAAGYVSNSGSSPAYKAQVHIYNRALGRLQGYTPSTGWLLGRGWEQRRAVSRAAAPTPWSAWGLSPWTRRWACRWIRRWTGCGVSAETVTPLPTPVVPELWPNMKETSDFPWHAAKSHIAEELGELTLLWWVGPEKRDAAHQVGVTFWTDPLATAATLGVTGDRTGPTLQAMLDVNHDPKGPPVRPAKVSAAEEVWRPVPPVEFYVDFETVTNLDDDFSKIPEQNGTPLIYMIGCGHLEDGEWVFRSFCVDDLAEASEAEIIDAWLNHMGSAGALLGNRDAMPNVLHWSYAEPVNYEEAYDSARNRHPEKGWPKLRWFDLWDNVVKKEPVVVRGALNFSLKSFARAMHRHGLIDTSWGGSQVDGLGAMVGAWACRDEAHERGVPIADIELMKEIARYNEVDCKVMMEILGHLRLSH